METNKIKITDIDPTHKYEGYLWWSDKPNPEVYQNETLPEWPREKTNPFIVEGQLYDKTNSKSFSIRFVDGEYLIYGFDLNELDGLEYIPKEYLPNRLEGVQKLCFKEFWSPVKDKLCGSKIGQEKDKEFEGMDVLQPAETVFVGFKNKED